MPPARFGHTGAMELLLGFRMRPARDEDADEVAAFANEECVALIGVPVIDADWLRAAGRLRSRSWPGLRGRRVAEG